MAPHLCEELWGLLGHNASLTYEPWPQYDESLTVESTVEIPVQILGKVRSRISVQRGMSKDDLEAAALADSRIQELIEGKTVRKVIVVPDRLVNIVAN
jgi:leucyl-tRNA synthetase